MPMPTYSDGFKWLWLSHSGNHYGPKVEYQKDRKIALWFPNKVLLYQEDFSKYGSENPAGWQPLHDLRMFLIKEEKT
jgi:hypothetical protein